MTPCPNGSIFFTRAGLLVALCAAAAFLRAQPIIWAVNDGEKIDRDDLANPNKRQNSAWSGKRISLFGARNEVIAFQVVVEAGDKAIGELRLAVQGLDRVGPVEVFSENYMRIPAPGSAGWIYGPGTPSAPANPTGSKPVQLVPQNARPGRGGFPLRVAARQNQAFWVEIYIRRKTVAREYRGEVKAIADGREFGLPVSLRVFDFTLPDENSIHAMFHYQPSQTALYQRKNLDDAYHRLAHRHRVELVHAYSEDAARAARGRFDGSAFTPQAGYEGPGEGVGNRILPLTFYGPGMWFDLQPVAWRQADQWMKFIDEFLPGAITFVYMPDEPSPAQYDRIRRIAGNIKSNPGPGKRLPVLVTKHWVEELDGSIDIWASTPGRFDIARANSERQKGRRYWTYNGGRPFAPAIVMESPATDPRAMIWACFKHSIDVYFYWHANHWRHNQQKPGEKNQNVWANPVTFDTRGQPGRRGSFAHGDGVLLYPGSDHLFPDQDRGVVGPIGTVQLANFRRGLQDHLYLTLARRLGLNELVEQAVRDIVPKVFSETHAAAPVAFAEKGSQFETWRYRLAEAIEATARRKPPRASVNQGDSELFAAVR